MNYLSIDLYKDFECIAGDCPNTCCAGWTILIDEATRQKMVEKEDDLGVKAEEWLIDRNGATCAKLTNFRCCMLNENNLCNVVLKLGPEYLSETCKQYPRLLAKYGSVIECHMSLSCPEIISQLMDKECIQFDFSSNEEKEEPFEYAELYLFESAVRTTMVNVMDALRNFSLETRLYIVYKMLEKAMEYYEQDVLDENALMQEISFYLQENVLLSFEQQMGGVVSENARFKFLKELRTVYETVITYGEYKDMLATATDYYKKCTYEDYIEHLELFREVTAGYERFYTNYWIAHIFLDAMAVPEYELAKGKMIYVAAEFCIIQSVALAIFVKNGMKLSREKYTLIISYICRIMEHNSEFRNKLTDILNENNTVSVAGLLLMILK